MKANRKKLDAMVNRLIDDGPAAWREGVRDEAASPEAGILGEIASLRNFAVESLGSRTERAPEAAQTWGSLEIRGSLGRGANAHVLRAWDDQLQHEVALKIPTRGDINEAQRTRMLNEGRRMVRVRHDNVVRIYGVLEHDERLALSMELVEGQTLADRVAADGSCSEGEARAMGMELADALCALHEAGIVHQDVKAQNVMRETGGRVVLMDLGSGVELGSDHLVPGGTPYYMAPELLVGGTPGRGSDVYSLGVLMHFLVTGAFPYEGSSLRELQAAHSGPRRLTLADRRPGLSTAFVDAVEKALHPDPEQRFQTAGEFREALSAAEDTGSSGGSSRWVRYAAAAAICAIVVWGAFNWLNRGFEVEAHVYRYEGPAQRTELMSGAGVEIGDRLTLEMELSRSLHVYVLNQDDRGNAYVLFPIEDSSLQNPLPGGVHELPGAREGGTRITWEVSSIGGRERLLIVAARDPVETLEEALARIPEASTSYPSVDASLLRGIGALSEVPADQSAPDGAIPDVMELLDGQEKSRGRWVRQFVLTNP